jgi:hypothetical protein
MNKWVMGVILILVYGVSSAQMRINYDGKTIFAQDLSETPLGQVDVRSLLNEKAQALYIDAPKSTTAFTQTFASLYLGNSNSTDGNYARLNFGDGDSAAVSTIGAQIENHAANSGTLEFWTRQSGQAIAKRMTVRSDGKVNIGGGPADYLFSVNGDASKVGGGTWSVPSDERLKKAIKPFTDGLGKILEINPVSFHYNGMGGIADTETEFVGILAQEMEAIAPYTITADSAEGYLQFNSNAVIYMLINAVKEQQAQIEKLESLIADQDSTSP